MTAAVSATAARKQSMSFNLSKYRGHASVKGRAKCHKILEFAIRVHF